MVSQSSTIAQQKITIPHIFLLLTLIITTLSFTAEDLKYQDHLKQIAKNSQLTFFQHSLGKSVKGHDIYVLGITAPQDPNNVKYQDFKGEPAILLTSTMHARQDTSFRFLYSAMEYIVNEFSDGNQQIRYLLSRVVLLVMPFVNIDSVMYSLDLTQKQVMNLRKNLNTKGLSQKCKYGVLGVDINRNFDYNFDTVQTSRQPCSQQYHGSSPFSQPQSKAIRTIFQQFHITTNIDIHGYGNLWIYPYASDKKTDKIKQHRLYTQYEYIFEQFKQLDIEVDNCFNSLKYVADGVYIDWALYKDSVSFALEFGDDFLTVGDQTDKHIQAMLEVFKINSNIFKYYLKTQKKSLKTNTQNSSSKTIKLCVKSISLLQHNVVLLVDDEVLQGKRLAPGSIICFNTNFDRMIDMESLHKLKVYVKLGGSQLKEEVHLHKLKELKEEVAEENGLGTESGNSGVWGFYNRFKIIIIGGAILCGIGCLCGMSIFCQNSLGMRMNDQQRHHLTQIQNNEGPQLRSGRMLRMLRGQNTRDNRVMQHQIELQSDRTMSHTGASNDQIEEQDDRVEVK